jgi:DNA polymerase-1
LPNLKRVLATGNTAATEFLNYKTKITRDRIGQPRFSDKYGVTVVPTIHPAAILRTADHFPTFVRDVHKLTNSDNDWHPPNYEVYNEPYPAKRALVNVPQGREIAVDIETTVEKDNSFQHPETLICVGIALDQDNAIIIERDALKNDSVKYELAELLDRTNVVYHNGKFDVGVLWQQFLIINMEGAIYGDTMLASYCLDERPGHHSLDELSQDLLGSPNWKHVTKQYDTFEDMPPEVLDEYNAYDVCNTLRLWAMLRGRLVAEELDKLHDNLCMISEGLIKIENAGINVDLDYLNGLDEEFTNNLASLESELKEISSLGNPRSWQQVTQTLYTEFGVETPSTDKEHLTQIYKGAREQGFDSLAHFVDLLLQHRKSTKLLGTYVNGIRSRLTNDGRIKPSFLLHATTTGRTSSRNPNMQTIPRESGIRNVFIPDDEDHVLVYADFDNIEGRITAVLADDYNLQRLFAKGIKPHKAVAKAVFGEDYSSEDYVLAKSVTHGVNYKRTPHGIAEGLDIPLHKATKVYNEYMKMAPGLPEWHNKVYKHVIVEQEDIVTPFGRRRRFPLITKENMEDVWREAVAFEPQSIASDLNTFAGIYLHKAGYDIRLFIHDALLLQVPRENAEDEARNISELMQQSAEANFPWKMSFPVEAESGYRWRECE